LSLGTAAKAHFIGGGEAEVRVSFIAAEAESQTRTFRVELELANPDGAIPAGITTEVTLPRAPVMAHRISPAILTLADNGKLGVRTVEEDGLVAFHEVSIIDETPEGVWVTGLPKEATVIVVGQEFVKDGAKVKAIDAKTLQPLAAGGAE
jgi:multidrug efflux system membrane fusion protein